MIKNYFLLIILFCATLSLTAQTNYSTQTAESLLKLKADAVKASDFTKAAEIKKELDVRDAEQRQINLVQADLDKKVKTEDFNGAAEAKKQLQVLKDNKAKKEGLRKQIATAVAASDFDKAAKLKDELSTLVASNGQVSQPSPSTEQKYFEGKVEFESTHQNVPAGEEKMYRTMKTTHYYKKNKRRTEDNFVDSNSTRKVTKIYNFDKGECLVIQLITPLNRKHKERKVVNIRNISVATTTNETILFSDEFKTISGYNCQKVNYKFSDLNSGNSGDIVAYAYKGFAATGFYGQKIPFLIVDYPAVSLKANPNILHINKGISISETPLSDDLFSTIPPAGYIVTDERSNTLASNKSESPPEPAKTSGNSTLSPQALPEVKYELSSTGDLTVKGVKLCNIKQTKKSNWLLGRGEEYTVYDNVGQEKLKTKGYPESKIIFVDDKKSFVPNIYSTIDELARFIARDSLFTAKGYNSAYKCDFIKKNVGSCYDINARPGENYINFELIGEDVFVYGKKMFSVRKTRAGNMLLETMPEFTVYDANGKAWMYFEGKEGKIMFLDDGKSFLPRKCDASTKSVAEFIAMWNIFNENGFRTDYRDQWISMLGGFNASKKLKEGAVRNKSDGIALIESMIFQSDMPIGSFRYNRVPNTEKETYQILNNNKVAVGYVIILNATSITESMVTINAEAVDLSGKITDSKSFSILKGYGDYLGTGLKWLVANNYL